jgi:citrate/tricarballylate utilization protein
MQALESLVRQARAEAQGRPTPEQEVARVLTICNGCRYCEGFCAVFPAMTRRLEFGALDTHYLANLCHNCGACLHACQYAPPHEFGVNVPRAMAQVRAKTYAQFAWPAALGRAYAHNGVVVAFALAAALTLFLVLGMLSRHGLSVPSGGNFYDLFPHNLLVAMFGPVFLFALVSLGVGVVRFWMAARTVTGQEGLNVPAAQEAATAALSLKYLDGGHGEGCHNEDDRWTQARRHCHHLTFYGFMLCLAATSVATLYHYVLNLPAPYPWPSLPKVLGVVGGISLSTGTAGLAWLKLRRNPLHGDPAQAPMDLGFVALLFLTATTGLGLWASTGTAAMPWLLCLHLGVVMALFVTLPCGKFAHGVYRVAALARHAVERRLPNPVGLGADA